MTWTELSGSGMVKWPALKNIAINLQVSACNFPSILALWYWLLKDCATDVNTRQKHVSITLQAVTLYQFKPNFLQLCDR
jgi:hypothetical protein